MNQKWFNRVVASWVQTPLHTLVAVAISGLTTRVRGLCSVQQRKEGREAGFDTAVDTLNGDHAGYIPLQAYVNSGIQDTRFHMSESRWNNTDASLRDTNRLSGKMDCSTGSDRLQK